VHCAGKGRGWEDKGSRRHGSAAPDRVKGWQESGIEEEEKSLFEVLCAKPVRKKIYCFLGK